MATTSSEDSIRTWTKLYKTCFGRRVRAERVTDVICELWSEDKISGPRLISIILTSFALPRGKVDPLVPAYLEQAFHSTSVDICDVLIALLSGSKYPSKIASQETSSSVSDLVVESVLTLLVRLVASSERPKTPREARRAVLALGEWLTSCNNYEKTGAAYPSENAAVLQMQNGGLRTPEPSVVSAFEALGTLAISLLSNAKVKEDLTNWPRSSPSGQKGEHASPSDVKERLASVCSDFSALLTQWSPSPVAARLQMVARAPPITDGKPDFSMADIVSNVVELPLSNSRIGLYVYLNAALCARPLTDDLTLFNYLHAKYPNDTQSLIIDLTVASFDVLANAVQRHQQSQHILCYRSFVANKLPSLISRLSTSLFHPLTAHSCIETALRRIDVHPFPPMSTESHGGVNDTLKKSRQDFVQACIMLQLGTEQAFNSVLGDSAFPISARTIRHVKESLVAQCISNVHRAEELARELESMNGNAGTISGALVETLQHFCDVKETMSLRTLCNILSRRLELMDVIMQYAQPVDVLFPLCNLLNDWTHDEDQSEFQPPYEEFASILLLVLAVIHRYQLTEAEFGITSQDSFVPKLLRSRATSIPNGALNEEQSRHLTKWVQGLYATDEQGETNGISDETMSHCPPQDFYLLVPTLLEQSLLACKSNVLAINTLKGGLEFLLEPFLLPSLIGGLSWLTKHSWQDNGDADIVLQMLHKLVRPDSISGDAQAMHQTIIAMIAQPLTRSLQYLIKRAPSRVKDAGALLEILTPHLDSQRSGQSSMVEVDGWCQTPNGGLRRAIRNIISGLVMWSNQAGMNMIPYNYTHRTILLGVRMLGADEVLTSILAELRSQTEVGAGSAALEICTALVCAPVPTQTANVYNQNPQSARPYRTLSQALRARLEALREVLKMETGTAEALVRLYRRVDAQQAVTQLSMPMNDIMHGLSITNTDLHMTEPANLGDPSATQSNQDFAMGQQMDLNASSVDDPTSMPLELSGPLFSTSQDMAFDLGGTSQQQDQMQFGSQSNEGQNQSTDPDDIFAGLDFDDDQLAAF